MVHKIKYIVVVCLLLLFYAPLYGQNTVTEGIHKQAAQNANTIYEDESLRVLLGLGYKYVHWSYRLQRSAQASSSSGSTDSVHQSSYYKSLSLNTAVMIEPPIEWSNIHLLVLMDIYFPLSTEGVVSPVVNDSEVKIVTSKVDYLVNDTEAQTLKGLGFEWLFGITQTIPQDSMIFIVGGGFATNVFVENPGSTNPRGTWGLGVGLQASIQFRFVRYFGLQVGVKGTYYPITFIDGHTIVSSASDDPSNKVKYEIKTTSFINSGIDVLTVWYF